MERNQGLAVHFDQKMPNDIFIYNIFTFQVPRSRNVLVTMLKDIQTHTQETHTDGQTVTQTDTLMSAL